MKNVLMSGAAVALMLIACPAHAQSYTDANNAKDHDSTLGNATTVQPEHTSEAAPMQTPAPVNTASAADTTPAPAIEPSSGGDNWQDTFRGAYLGGEGEYTFGGSSIDGFGGGGFAGYGWTPHVDWVAKPYLGAEIGFDWSGADSDTLAQKKAASFSLRPGAVWGTNVLGYGILGYKRGDMKSNITNDNDWDSGWSVGGGVEIAPWTTTSLKPLHVRLEYAYTNYDNRDLGGDHVDPHTNDIKLGLLYRFR